MQTQIDCANTRALPCYYKKINITNVDKLTRNMFDATIPQLN